MSDQHHNQPQHGFHDDEKRNAHDQFGREHHFEDGQIHPTRTLHYEDSPDSTNGFVKVEKPHDFPSSGHPVVLNATGYPVVLDSEQQQIEITPSDEVAPPTGDDFRRDYAPSPQQFATELASNTTESLEQFLAATQRTAADAGNKGSRYVSDLVGQFSPVEEEPSNDTQPQMYEEEEEEEEEDEHSPDRLQKAKEEVVKRIEDVQAKMDRTEEPEESMYRRQGPLTLGNPASISSLSPQHHGGLTDMVYDTAGKVSEAAHAAGTKISDAAHDVGSKIHEATGAGEEKIFKADSAPFKHDAFERNRDSLDELGHTIESKAEDISEKVYERTKEFGGKVVDSAAAAKEALSEFASNVSTGVSNTADDLLGEFNSPQNETAPAVFKPEPTLVSSLKTQETAAPVTLASSLKTQGTLTKSPDSCSSCCFNLKSMDPRVSDLIHWRDPRKTGVVFAVTLAYLICLAVFPVISVLAYTGLVIILATLSFRLYKMIKAFINKTEQQNPFKPYLESNLQVPQDRMHQQVDNVANHIQNLMVQLRRLFLVENVADTLKFAVLLWSLTYVGACLSVMALVIIAFVGLFTLPKFYETYKTQIDHYYNIVHSKAKQASETVQEKIPQLKKKTHAE